MAGVGAEVESDMAPEPGEELLADLRVVQQLEVAGTADVEVARGDPGFGELHQRHRRGAAVRHEQVPERTGEARAAGHRGGDEAVIGVGQQRQEVAVVVDAVDVTVPVQSSSTT